MGVGKINIWVSDVDNPCGTWDGEGYISIFECKDILRWPCGRYLAVDGTWKPVPNGRYINLPFKCGHLEVEVPPGCYMVSAAWVTPNPGYFHLNYATHMGIVQVDSDETTSVKLFNPTLRLCWNLAVVGLKLAAASGKTRIDPVKVDELVNLGEDLLRDSPMLPIERVFRKHFEDLLDIDDNVGT